MKLIQRILVALLVRSSYAAVLKHRGSGLRHTDVAVGSGSNGAIQEDGQSTKVAFEASIASYVEGLMEGKPQKLHDIAEAMHSKMDVKEAVQQLDGRLPEDVASLVHMTGAESAQEGFNETSLQKARVILNDMILTAWGQLDDVIFECKTFRDRNRGNYEQVTKDLARLGSDLSNLDKEKITAIEGSAEQEKAEKQVKGMVETTKRNFQSTYAENSHEMSIRKNDLAVFDFILKETSCKGEEAEPELLQLGTAGVPRVRVCDTSDGLQLKFTDTKLQARIESMMTPEARKALEAALGGFQSSKAKQGVTQELAFLQIGEPVTTEVNTTTPQGAATVEAETLPVNEEPNPEGQWKKCSGGNATCYLLHDMMSIEWGKFQDSFDELAAEMKGNQDEYDETMENLNGQLSVISETSTRYMQLLTDSISSINSVNEEKGEKEEQEHALRAEFEKKCKEFREKIMEILFTQICALRKVRNAIMEHSETTPPAMISDCDFTDWAGPEDGLCRGKSGSAITCDDKCDANNLDCGGLETLVRKVVVLPNPAGMQCPAMKRQKPCAQFKCPVNCVQSEWSGWSECTKECGSGVEGKTRSILTKPKHGGDVCGNVQEEKTCNDEACKRDCTLKDWSEWGPCSMACSGGITTRKREVLVPIRANGKCPKKRSPDRFEEKECNTQDCVGDEICIAKQDLVILLDASGSMRKDGFEALRAFAANLTSKYQSEYFGAEAMKVGLVLFGNGHLIEAADGTNTISEAIVEQELTPDIDLVISKIEGSKFQKGFTNMAQGLAAADKVLERGGRSEAQSAVLVLSDGKYSMKYQTEEKFQELKDKNVQVFMAPVDDFPSKGLELMKTWASQPWETNYERIPGLQALEYNTKLFADKLIVKFCPDAFSPSQMKAKEEEKQYMLIHEGGFPSDDCGMWYWQGHLPSMDDCAAAAREKGLDAFSYGHGYALHACYSEAIPVTPERWEEWKIHRRAPPCPGGRYLSNPYFDVYAIQPMGGR